MPNTKQHIIFKAATLALVLTLILPSVVKFSHVFSHHKHEICLGENQTHLHALDLDCDFYKFKLLTHFLHIHNEEELLFNTFNLQNNHLNYDFLYNHRPLSYSLRGPPCLI